MADSTILIFLGKLRRLDWLRDEYQSVLIPDGVCEEVVEQGKELGAHDAILVENAIDDGWIEVHEIPTHPQIEKHDLGRGETEVLSLTIDQDHDEVLIDEERGRDVARLQGISPRGTLSFLFAALANGDLTFEEFMEHLETLLDEGFSLDEAVYLKAVRQARQLADNMTS